MLTVFAHIMIFISVGIHCNIFFIVHLFPRLSILLVSRTIVLIWKYDFRAKNIFNWIYLHGSFFLFYLNLTATAGIKNVPLPPFRAYEYCIQGVPGYFSQALKNTGTYYKGDINATWLARRVD